MKPSSAGAPGWYGKLPALGDFASRRLDPGWIECWDDWLAAELGRLKADRPEQWLDDYLASPAWRFALMPGAMPGATAGDDVFRVGVLVPSVDRVGRYFPLAVASPALALPFNIDVCLRLWQWCSQLEDIAVEALQEDWPAETMDEALLACPAPAFDDDDQATLPAALDERLPTWINGLVAGAALRDLAGASIWANAGAATVPMLCRGLPQGAFLTGCSVRQVPIDKDPAATRILEVDV